MILLLAALLASPAPGCRTVGSGVHCVLAPPVTVAVAPPPAPELRPSIAWDRSHRSRPRIAHVAPHHMAPRPSSLPDAAEIAHHIASLVAIADCTGARTFAASAGEAALAERTFAACIGRPSPPGLPSAPVRADTGAQIGRGAAPAVSERPS